MTELLRSSVWLPYVQAMPGPAPIDHRVENSHSLGRPGPGRKFTMQQARDCRQRASAGESPGSLAEEFGVHVRTMEDLLSGWTYREDQSHERRP